MVKYFSAKTDWNVISCWNLSEMVMLFRFETWLKWSFHFPLKHVWNNHVISCWKLTETAMWLSTETRKNMEILFPIETWK